MPYPSEENFAELLERVTQLETSRNVKTAARQFWLPVVLSLFLLILGVESFINIPTRAGDAAIAAYKQKINVKLDTFLADEGVNEVLGRIEKALETAQTDGKKIADILDMANQNSLFISSAKKRTPGLGQRVEIPNDESKVMKTADEDGFVLALLTYDHSSAHHGSIRGFVGEDWDSMDMLAANEYSRDSNGTASIMMPVRNGQKWKINAVKSGELGGTMPPVRVFWIPIRSFYSPEESLLEDAAIEAPDESE